MSLQPSDPPAALPTELREEQERDVFSYAPFALEHMLPRLNQYETPLAIVDEKGRVVDANGPWLRRGGSGLCCAVGGDLTEVCGQQALEGDAGAERFAKELAGILRGRTQFCEWDAAGGDHVRLARLVAVSGTYALAAFQGPQDVKA